MVNSNGAIFRYEMMKTRLLIIIGIVIIGVIVASTAGTMEYQSTYNQNCNSDGGKIVGFLKCIYINEDFGETRTSKVLVSENPLAMDTSERRIVTTTPFGYYQRDTTGNYDHCFSYKTDPKYGVKIQNSTHILNLENCEWESENTPSQLRGVLGNCACQERIKVNPDTRERCPQPELDWRNATHYIDNIQCEMKKIEIIEDGDPPTLDLTKMCKETGQGNMWSAKYDSCINITTPFSP